MEMKTNNHSVFLLSYHITLEEWNSDEDHVHVLFRAHP
ncbi:MAG: IS200/IS605 family transposase, partial [Vallitaleaceae bacterium]|nr:IS200/IS605 family transposase [Vallitaleaceae bacterium]